MKFDKDKLKESLTKEDINKILSQFDNKDSVTDSMGNIIFPTVCHGGNKHKLYYYVESNQFHCYTDCSETFDIYDLVIRAKKNQGYALTFSEAVRFVANITGKRIGFIADNQLSDAIDDWDWIKRLEEKSKPNIELPVYNENVLEVFMPYPHEDWLKEGISYETMKKFEIGYYTKDERIIIPHRDINGRLVGVRGRAMLKDDINDGKKYMPIRVNGTLYRHQTMFNLYGLNHTKEAIKRLRKVIIYEGEKSVMKTEDYYGDDNFSCAACSSNITSFHRDIILSLGVEEVFIAFDKHGEKDKEEKIIEYQERLKRFARLFTPFARVYVLWDDFNLLDFKDSPVDSGKEALEQLMKTKYEITTINEVKN